MTITNDTVKALSAARVAEVAAAKKREIGYLKNVNATKRAVDERMRQAAQAAKDAGRKHLSPVEMMKVARASERERIHKQDAETLKRNGIKLDDIKPYE